MNEDYLIKYLKEYNHQFYDFKLDKENEIRALMNITMPYNLAEEFYLKQDEFLQDRLTKIKITNVDDFIFNEQIALFKGDITTIKADAIVNACNEKLLGCFQPLHKCIDNAIHSYAGLQVRRDLIGIMSKQGHDEENGGCKVTGGYNLPCKYIFHTVGPKCFYNVTKENEKDLANCYLSCLKEADKMNLKSIVFCSISTGVYGYPITKAALVAVDTVRNYLKNNDSKLKVVFNLFSEENYQIYERQLSKC